VVRNFGDRNPFSTNPFPVHINRTIASSPTNIWNFQKYIPDGVVIFLGINDYSTQPNPSDEMFLNGYRNMIKLLQLRYGNNVKLLLICYPVNQKYCNNVRLISNEFVNSRVVQTNPLRNPSEFGCDGHPNLLGHRNIYEITRPVLKQLLNW
jgi:hypothetical protein